MEEREKRCRDREEASEFSRRSDPDSDEDEDYEGGGKEVWEELPLLHPLLL